MQTELNMKENGICKLVIGMEEVIKYGAMEVFMRGIGRMITPTEEDD